MNRIRILGKSISITVAVILLVAGIASAALVSYYTSTEGTVDVSGPLNISPSTYTLSLNASETRTMPIEVTNKADQEIFATLNTTITGPEGLNIVGDESPVGNLSPDGIVITYDTVPESYLGNSQTTITVTVETNPALVPGTYIVTTKLVPT